MFSVKRSCTFLLLFSLYSSFSAISVRAQFWHILPPVSDSDAISAGFSNDQKKIYFIRRDGGIANVWSTVIMDKYGGIIAGPKSPVVQVTKFNDRGVVRFFHLLNRPEILFMRTTDNGKDFHIYRMKDDGTDQPQDLTPGGNGVTNIIIGASYDGRYVYYTNNAVHQDKVDVYRYDTQQFTSDLIFPNDKDYEVLAWTRDQNKLLVEDSSSSSFMMYDIETTVQTPLKMPDGRSVISATLDPTNTTDQKGYKLNIVGMEINNNLPANELRDSNSWEAKSRQAMFEIDYSPNCKYTIQRMLGRWTVKDVGTNAPLPISEGTRPIAIAPKETLLLYLDGSKLYLYDISKNASTELATVR
jgi:hypothetical protein